MFIGRLCLDIHTCGSDAYNYIPKMVVRRVMTKALSSNFGKRPLAKIGEKMIDLSSKFEEINDIICKKGSKIYPQNQVILDCIMSSIPLKHKC